VTPERPVKRPPCYTGAVRRLIINADDFGLTSGVNRAIVEGNQRGTITSATLMATGPAFDEAVELAQSCPSLSVGCHIVLVDGAPVLDASQIPSLIDGDSPDPAHFRQAWGSFARAALSGRLAPQEIEAEATAQIRKLQSAGVVVSHVDTHKHAHVFPAVLRPLLRAAKACGVRVVRNPFEPARLSLLAQRPGLWKRWMATRMLRGFAGTLRRAVLDAGMAAPDGALGVTATGALDVQLLAWIIERLPEGTWELVCHPGYNDTQLQAVRTRLRQSRAQELELLTSCATLELLSRNSIDLISYRQLT
jgi:hopanoid biosynthesis associated protein HpnK